jgi:hypothetical protein
LFVRYAPASHADQNDENGKQTLHDSASPNRYQAPMAVTT